MNENECPAEGQSNLPADERLDVCSAESLIFAAFEKYFEISKVLTDDFFKLYDIRSDDQFWKRNHIRVLCVLIEGYSLCFREIGIAAWRAGAAEFTSREIEFLENERSFGMEDRIKISLKLVYSLLSLDPAPDFGKSEWPLAKKALRKRSRIMHPKSVEDLDIQDQEYQEIDQGLGWLVRQHTNVIELFYQKNSSVGAITN